MHLWRLNRCFSAKITLTVLSVLAFHGCATLEQDPAAQRAQIDAPDYFDLSLRDDVPITIAVDEHMISLAYKETANNVDEPVSDDTRIVNVYLILTGVFEHAGFNPRNSRLIINIWIFNPADRTKTCYQWRLTDADLDGLIDDAVGEIIMENQEDTVTGIRPSQSPNRDLNDYSQLYRKCSDHLLKRFNVHSLDELFKLQADNLYKEKQLVL